MKESLTHRERFHRLFSFEKVDCIPCYFFGSWAETKARWVSEGFKEIIPGSTNWQADSGPQLRGMDPDWETGMWENHGLVNLSPIGDLKHCVISEDDTRRIVHTSIGEEMVIRKDGVSISHTLKHPLEPNRKSWDRFKLFLSNDDLRYPVEIEQKAVVLNSSDRVLPLMGGSLYGWLRAWLGVENISYLMYDDPCLFEEMVAYVCNHFMRLTKPVVKHVKFDFVYFFEDCCGASGPLFSPEIYKQIFDKYYQKLINFYKDNGIPFALIDSDGFSEPLIPSWLGSGFDILFPIEVGKWGANPGDLRAKHGKIKMFGAVNKTHIYGSEATLRHHLESLVPSVLEGGFLPIPDHRIPPEVSLEHMQRYIQIFNEVFNEGSSSV
jgi:uroporphyrinogen decarboxylase